MKINKTSSLTIKLIITAILGALGIMYILEKPPTSEINSYQKQGSPKYYRDKNNDNSSLFSSENSNDNDAISLTGKKGGYDQHVIGSDKK